MAVGVFGLFLFAFMVLFGIYEAFTEGK